jgi:DNA invertase Pin-like site-specific DNA recombinase
MGMPNFINYFRCSTQLQGLNGLGMAAQKNSVESFVKQQNGTIIAEFAEIESGAKNDRPQLMAALSLAKKTKATLLVARLDRLSRDSAFLITLQRSEVSFVCVDMPQCDSFSIALYAILAQKERETIALRVKVALEAAKRRGVKLGTKDPVRQVRLMNEGSRRAKQEFREKMIPIVQEIRATGVRTLQGVADCLNRKGLRTRTGKSFVPGTISNLLE